MDIVDLAKEIQESYEILYAKEFKDPDLEKDKVSKNYCLKRIDALRDELLKMKKEINKMCSINRYWKRNHEDITFFINKSDLQYIADLVYKGDVNKVIQNTVKQIAFDLLCELGVEHLKDEIDKVYKAIDEDFKTKWISYEPGFEGSYTFEDLSEKYMKEVRKNSSTDDFFLDWLCEMEKSGILIKENKIKMIESSEKHVKTYNETDYGYYNNATMIYGELNDGNYYVYIPDNDAFDIYNTRITKKFIDASYNYNTDDDRADDYWYDQIVKWHQITSNYSKKELNTIIDELDKKYYNQELKESK